MKKAIPVCLSLMLVVFLFGCGRNSEISETEPVTEPTVGEYGMLQELVESYGFPFELRYAEGMELTGIRFYEDSAEREWHTSDDSAQHDSLHWELSGNTLEITGSWSESFTLDMERGTATSLTDGAEYRFVVKLPGSIDTQFYVIWPSDEGFTEIDGVRQ